MKPTLVGARGQTPDEFNPDPYVQDGINRAGELFDNNRCKTFISRVLQRAAADIDARWWATKERYTSDGNGFYPAVDFASALGSYANAFNNGWVTASGNPGAHDGSVTYGTTRPTGHYPVSWNDEFFSLSRNERGLNTLHEALHQFPGFDDATLANAARFVDGQAYRDYTRDRNPVGAASQNLNELIRDYCAPR